MTGRNDKLIVKGHGRADGEYVFDLRELLNVGTAGALNILEQNQVLVISGVRPAGLPQAFVELDAMVMVALAHVILARNGHTVRVDALTQGHLAYSDGSQDVEPLADIKKGLLYLVDQTEDEEDDALPPAAEPSEPSETPQPNGGESTKPSSASQETDPSLTGHQGSLRSVISGPETLAS